MYLKIGGNCWSLSIWILETIWKQFIFISTNKLCRLLVQNFAKDTMDPCFSLKQIPHEATHIVASSSYLSGCQFHRYCGGHNHNLLSSCWHSQSKVTSTVTTSVEFVLFVIFSIKHYFGLYLHDVFNVHQIHDSDMASM